MVGGEITEQLVEFNCVGLLKLETARKGSECTGCERIRTAGMEVRMILCGRMDERLDRKLPKLKYGFKCQE